MTAHVAVAQMPAIPVIPGNAQATAQLAAIIDAARAQNLPVDPIIGKVNYALLRVHARADTVLSTARGVAARLSVARDALAPRANALDIAQAEEALSFHVSREIITRIRAASNEQSIAVPLGTLTQLVASHIDANRAAEIVLSLVKRGATSQQLADFGTNVNTDVMSGGRPDEALAIRMRFLTAALAPAAGHQGTGDLLNGSVPGPARPPKP